jgi:uncharacterized protein
MLTLPGQRQIAARGPAYPRRPSLTETTKGERMSRVVHFEIMAREPQKAIDFYSTVLDWKFEKQDNPGLDYWLVTTGDERAPGINGGLASGDPIGAVVNTIGVADVDATLQKVEENGGKIVRPREPLPGMGPYATFEDPAGNQFGLMQVNPAEVVRPDSVGNEQSSLSLYPEGRAPLEPGRTTGAKTARRPARPARQSSTRTSRSGSQSRRPHSRSNSKAAGR